MSQSHKVASKALCPTMKNCHLFSCFAQSRQRAQCLFGDIVPEMEIKDFDLLHLSWVRRTSFILGKEQMEHCLFSVTQELLELPTTCQSIVFYTIFHLENYCTYLWNISGFLLAIWVHRTHNCMRAMQSLVDYSHKGHYSQVWKSSSSKEKDIFFKTEKPFHTDF